MIRSRQAEVAQALRTFVAFGEAMTRRQGTEAFFHDATEHDLDLAVRVEAFGDSPLPTPLLQELKRQQSFASKATLDPLTDPVENQEYQEALIRLYYAIDQLPPHSGPPDCFLRLDDVHPCWLGDSPGFHHPSMAFVHLEPGLWLSTEDSGTGKRNVHRVRLVAAEKERLLLPPELAEAVTVYADVLTVKMMVDGRLTWGPVVQMEGGVLYPNREGAEATTEAQVTVEVIEPFAN